MLLLTLSLFLSSRSIKVIRGHTVIHTSSTTDCKAVFLFDFVVLFSFSSISFFSLRYGSNLAFGDRLFSPNGGVAELVSELIFFSGAKFNRHMTRVIFIFRLTVLRS